MHFLMQKAFFWFHYDSFKCSWRYSLFIARCAHNHCNHCIQQSHNQWLLNNRYNRKNTLPALWTDNVWWENRFKWGWHRNCLLYMQMLWVYIGIVSLYWSTIFICLGISMFKPVVSIKPYKEYFLVKIP